MNFEFLKEIDYKLLIKIIIKYVIQGLVIAFCVVYIPTIYKTSLRKPTFNEIYFIAVTSALTMFLLDTFEDHSSSLGYKLGAGFLIAKGAFA